MDQIITRTYYQTSRKRRADSLERGDLNESESNGSMNGKEALTDSEDVL